MPHYELFPPIDPYLHDWIDVSPLHSLYWEECGNPNGKPIIFLHGGPGAGCTETHRRFFNPRIWRTILFDQRGSGRSRPFAETRDNTLELLVEDIEKLRQARGIDKWHVMGGSWGSTLALAYAQAYPERCLSLVLRGIFLFQKAEIDWFFNGLRNVYPEAWQRFADFIPADEQHDLLAAYDKIFSGNDLALKIAAERVWLNYEISCSSLLPPLVGPNLSDTPARSALPVLEAHYFLRNIPKPDHLLLDRLDRIRHIPTTIVQGRYDMICPIVTADTLHRHWLSAAYRVIPDAGHSSMEPGTLSALVETLERYGQSSI